MVGTQAVAVLGADLAEPDPTIVSRFAQVVALRRDEIAIRDDAVALTFAEVDRRSSALARVLIADGDESPVGILLGQGCGAIVAMLSALKAGRPFVPLDPMLPPARLGQILRMAGVLACV